ncbi:hypothetical protein CCP3SC15_420012 [Gammaproteobacteria bacterium]
MTEEQRLVCNGHQELREIALETRNDVRHMTDEIRMYMQRKDREEEALKARVAYLELNGAKISQENAANIVKIFDELGRLKQGCGEETAVQKFWDSWITRLCLILGTLSGIAVGVFELFSWLMGKKP